MKNKFKLSLLALVLGFTISSCNEEEYENTTAIIGKWKLVSITAQGSEINPEEDFLWEFNEDETYSIINSHGKLEDDPFDSNPFRGKSEYKGGYHVNAPKGLVIREKFKSPFYFSAVNINESKMQMEFIPQIITTKPEEQIDYIKLTFEK